MEWQLLPAVRKRTSFDETAVKMW